MKENRFSSKDGYTGVLTILYVVLFIIAIYGVMAFSEIVSRSFLINETQSIMDTSGLAALRMGLDDEQLRLEKFEVNETVVEQEYKRLLKTAMKDYGAVDEYRVVRLKIRNIDEKWGLGVTAKAREQAVLDSTVMLVVDTYTPLDVYPYLSNKYQDGYEGEDFTINYIGQTEDGKAELMVRSVTRLVYR